MYRRLVRLLLPADFRQQHEDELVKVFSELLAEARTQTGSHGPAAVWGRELVGLLRLTWRLRTPGETPRGGRWSGAGVSWLDVKLGLRMLVKHPGMTLVSGLAMAVTIAIAVGTFSMLQDRLFRPKLPLPEGDRIVSMGLHATDRGRPSRQLLHDFDVWRDEVRSVQQLSIWRGARLNVVGEDGIGRLTTFTMMSASGFEVVRLNHLAGHLG